MEVLVKGQLMLIDDVDLDLFLNHKWHLTSGGRYIGRSVRVAAYKQKTEWFHRVVAERLYGELPSHIEVDHINRNRYDNRRQNLRLATHAKNVVNASKRKDNTTGVKGVHFDKRSGKYKAQININGKRTCLGSFKTLEEARIVYTRKSLELHGEFTAVDGNINSVS